MEQLITAFLSSAVSNSPLVIALVIALIYFKKNEERKDTRIEQLITNWDNERKDRIGILEEHVNECNRRHDEALQREHGLLLRMAQLEPAHEPPPEPLATDPARRITQPVPLSRHARKRNPADGQA